MREWLIRALFLVLSSTSLAGCASPARVPERTPVRWIVVEKKVGELLPDGVVGEGRLDPAAQLLALQPLYREDLEWEVVVDPHDYFVEVLEISPGTSAAPGEVVTAKVRVGRARKGERYRLLANASQAGVQVLGDAEHIVKEGATAVFRFTSSLPGAGGIAVSVERVSSGLPPLP